MLTGNVTCLMNIIHTCTNDYFESVSFSIGKFFAKSNSISSMLLYIEFHVCNLEIAKILIPSIIIYLVFPNCEAYTCIGHNFYAKFLGLESFRSSYFYLHLMSS